MQNFYKYHLASRYCYFVSNSLGELDFIYPMILSIKKKITNANFEICFTNNKISRQYLLNSDYQNISSKLGIKINCNPIKLKLKSNPISNSSKLIELLFLIKNFLNIINSCFKSEVIFLENSGRALGNKFLRIFSFLIKRKIILLPHTSNRYPFTDYKNSIQPIIFRNSNYLVCNKKTMQRLKKTYKKGFPIYFEYPINNKWINFIKKNFKKNNDEYITIYLNNLIDKRTYIYLLLVSLKQIIKSKKNIKILIKRHPRNYNYELENLILKKILKKFKDKVHISVTQKNSFILSTFSIMNICLSSNAIFLVNAMNKNSVYFFIFTNELKKRINSLPNAFTTKGLKIYKGKNRIKNFLQNYWINPVKN